MRRKFYLHKRNGIYYAELVDPISGKKLTKESHRDNALLIVSDWLKNGLPSKNIKDRNPVSSVFNTNNLINTIKTADLSSYDALKIVKILHDRGLTDIAESNSSGSESELFTDFISRLWSWESPFIREKLAYNHKISKRHCSEMIAMFKRNWYDSFCNKTVGEIKREDIKIHLMNLKDLGFSTSTLNLSLNVVAAPLGWAFREGLISSNPAAGIKRFSGTGRKRDILTTKEIRDLIALDWPDIRGKLAFLVALTCGLRLGEVSALQLKDIGDDRLFVRHSWSGFEGLKSPKNGEERETPLLPELRDGLRKLGSKNFWGTGDDRYIFFSQIKNQPIDYHVISDQFIDALHHIGIDEKTRKERNLVFHSIRHGYVKILSSRIDQQTAMRVTGHLTQAVFSHYADHKVEEDFKNLINVNQEIWNEILIDCESH